MGFQKFGGRGTPRGGRGSYRGGRGGSFSNFDNGPPEQVIEVGTVLHPCQEDVVCKLITEKVPYSNAPVYLENKEQIGKVDEIFGPIKDAKNSKFYMDPARFMPIERVLNPFPPRGRGGRGRGDSTPNQRRGSFRGGRGDFRGNSNNRGDFRGRGGNRGGRGDRGGGNFNRGRGDRNSFGGKRPFMGNNSTPQVKKFKSE